MSMSTRVVGFKPPGEKWVKMRTIWDACKAAGVEIPGEVMGFFNGEEPDPVGVEIPESELRNRGAVKEWGNDYAQGFEVDVTKLGKDVTVLRFYNSW